MPDAVYSLHAPLPVFLVRARDNAIEAVFYDEAGAIAAPTSGTIDVYDSAQEKAVDGATVTPANSRAPYTIPASAVPVTQSFSAEWQVRWTMVMPDGATHTFIQEAHLCRSSFKMPCRPQDITDAHAEATDLLEAGDDNANLQKYLTRAGERIIRRLLGDDRMPWRILSSHSLFDPQLTLALHFLFFDADSSIGGVDGKYKRAADHYAAVYEDLWAKLRTRYDSDDDGLPSEDEAGQAADTPNLWLKAGDSFRWGVASGTRNP